MIRALPKPAAWIAAVVACGMLFGVLSVLPNVWQRFDDRYPFAGIEMMGTDQEFYYATRIREFQDGFPMVGSAYYAEYKNQPFVQPPLPEWVVGGLGTMLGLNAARTALMEKLLFGCLLFTMMTVFCMLLSGRRWWSLLAVSALLYAGFVFSAPHLLPDVVLGRPLALEFLRFSRLTNPLFSSTLFFTALCLYLLWLQRGSRAALAGCGVFSGLCFYAYPYAWSYLGVAFGLSLLFLWVVKRDRRRALELAAMGMLVAVIAAPYFLHQFSAVRHNESYPLMLLRFCVVHTRHLIGGLWMLVFVLLPLAARRFAPFRPTWFAGALAATGVILMNQQLITGTMLMPLHYHWYYIQPLSVLCWILFLGAALCDPVVRRMPHGVRAVLFVLCLSFCAFLGVRTQYLAYQNVRSEWGTAQQVSGVLAYLDDKAVPGIVTYTADDMLRELVTVYTSGDVYDADNAPLCLCPDDRRLTPYYFRLWLEGVDAAEARTSFFTTRKPEVSSQLRGSYYREAYGGYDRIPEDHVRMVLEGYESYLSLSTDDKLGTYLLHYLAFRKDRVPDTPQAREVLARTDTVFDDEYFVLWKLRP